jgi:hypothetical protein
MVLDNPTPDTTDESVTPQDPSTMKMDEGEFQALREAADSVGVQDVQLGRALNLFVLHLGHLYGFDPAQEDEKARKAEEDKETAEQEQAEEDAKTPEQSSFSATPDHGVYPDGSTPVEDAPSTDVPLVNQEGV